MGFWSGLFRGKAKTEYEAEINEAQYYEVSNFTDDTQRTRYIESCLEQMKTASDEIIYDLSVDSGYYLEEENQL